MTDPSPHIVIREIVATEWIERAWPLLADHREELTTMKDIMRLAPDIDTYRAIEAQGRMLTLGAFDADDELVGYSANIIGRNLHYSDVIMAENDVLFVARTHRQGTLGLRMIRETERAAAARGVDIMVWHAKPSTNLDLILTRRGYRVQDVMYTRVL